MYRFIPFLLVSIFCPNSPAATLNSGGELPGAGPMTITSSKLMEKDYQTLRLRWAEKRLLSEAETRWKGKPWAGEARAVTLEGFKVWIFGQPSNETLAAKADALIKAGCNEPLACLMAHKLQYGVRTEWRAGKAAYLLSHKAVNNPEVSVSLRTWIAEVSIQRTNWLGLSNNKDYANKQAERIATAINDPGYDAEFEPVLVGDFNRWFDALNGPTQESFETIKQSIAASTKSEWVKSTLLTGLEIKWAWAIRGGGWASTVTDEAAKGFSAHLELAAQHAQNAWKLRPDRPEAAALMITVLMGQGAPPEKMREWFDRSVRAQFDYIPAYRRLLNACSARWMGSNQHVLTLGRRFAETKRYDTQVPAQLFQACSMIAVEQADARAIFSHTLVRGPLLELARNTLKRESLDDRNRAAIIAWLAGDDSLAAEALRASAGQIGRAAKSDLNELLLHADAMLTSVAAGSGVWGEAVKAVELSYRHGEPAQTYALITALRPQDLQSEAARAYTTEIRTVYELRDKLKDGAWHPLPVYPGLATCLSTGGDWKVTAPGEITYTGYDGMHGDLVFLVGSTANFEFRGEISILPTPENDWLTSWTFSPMLLWQPERYADGPALGVRGVLSWKATQKPKVWIAGQYPFNHLEDTSVTLAKSNPFQLGIPGTAATFVLNAENAASQSLASLGLESPRGLVGLSGTHVPFGTKVVIRKLEVRNRKQSNGVEGG